MLGRRDGLRSAVSDQRRIRAWRRSWTAAVRETDSACGSPGHRSLPLSWDRLAEVLSAFVPGHKRLACASIRECPPTGRGGSLAGANSAGALESERLMSLRHAFFAVVATL